MSKQKADNPISTPYRLPRTNQFMNETAPHPARYMRGCNPLIQQARQDRLDTLYAQDGRHDPAHESHGIYTGLWAKYIGTPCTDEAPCP